MLSPPEIIPVSFFFLGPFKISHLFPHRALEIKSKALTINDATTIQTGNEELVLITPTTPENKKKVEKA